MIKFSAVKSPIGDALEEHVLLYVDRTSGNCVAHRGIDKKVEILNDHAYMKNVMLSVLTKG